MQNGLRDRELVVRSIAATLLTAWVEIFGESIVKDEKRTAEGHGKNVEEDVVALLQMFDLADSSVAEDVLLSVSFTRVDLFESLQFGGKFFV